MRYASDSVCYGPHDQKRKFHKCTTTGVNRACFFDNELKRILIGKAPAKQFVFKGALLDLIQCAAHGDLLPPERQTRDDSGVLRTRRDAPSVSPCATQPDIWELRKSDVKGELYRLYFAQNEVTKADRQQNIPELVLLLIHQKEVEGLSSDEIAARQNEKMKAAQERYTRYKDSLWGHVAQSCRYYIDRRLITDELEG